MLKKDFLWRFSCFLGGIVLGIIITHMLLALSKPRVLVNGNVYYEPPVDEVATAQFPEGHYVFSRIYIKPVPDKKSVSLKGILTTRSTKKGITYPMVVKQ